MAQSLIFVYALIIFLFLFRVEAEHLKIRCVTDDDCPKVEKPLYMYCGNHWCAYKLHFV
ncbi:putative Late nodulin [Medicago truncatula]|uniref:Nodule Cysteine-Rich (NCR) secreted peptide n=1 Tax=Medicago truncatula TaxID=3880 RepID=G7KNA5_MEDTR|nr:Nodule Cysteine-Rich (NCR) secreted peptide [Medicago truncatula]RHN52086.1 putative Late nodulin [Medicago truncatula]